MQVLMAYGCVRFYLEYAELEFICSMAQANSRIMVPLNHH